MVRSRPSASLRARSAPRRARAPARRPPLTRRPPRPAAQEATVVCVDNSEHTRNGDYAPTRFLAQADAVNLLAGAKTQHHPENAVGVLAMGGAAPRVLVTPTTDLGKVLGAMGELRIEGPGARLATAVQVAQLALKHRENKNQRQRIVVFVGSPLAETSEELVKIGKRLKKNNVAVDVIAFGSEEENAARLEAFHGAVDSGGNSHLVTVPPGVVLSDALFGTPIFQAEGGGDGDGGGEAAGGGAPRANVVDGFDYGALGVDPALDPELALALRVSMEEEAARQAAAEGGAGGEGGEGGGADAADADAGGVADIDEDALLQQALALSAGGGGAGATPGGGGGAGAPTPAAPAKGAPPAAAPTPAAPAPDAAMGGGEEEEDPELALALAMSMAQEQPKEEGGVE
jgi:26S proteasome regulatory subunit N10